MNIHRVVRMVLGVSLLVLVCHGMAFGRVHHVNKSGTGTVHDGWTWASAFRTLQEALDVANAGDQIWVAKGTYRPDEWGATSGDRYASFALKTGVIVKGGFAGYEDCPGQEDWRTHPTILSGNIGKLKERTDNSYHVVTGSGTDGTAVLDGFTIMDGYANGSGNFYGGGMYNLVGSPTIRNCTFQRNYAEGSGGGMYNTGSDPQLINCDFIDNDATAGGGAYNYNSDPELINCRFIGNEVSGSGGGMYNTLKSNPTLINCVFSGNSAKTDGGGMYNHDSKPALTNCTLSGNLADFSGGGIRNYDSAPLLENCILWGNKPEQVADIGSSASTLSYCDIQGGWGGSGGKNIDKDPQFMDADGADNRAGTVDDNLRLGADSPCIDAGDNDAYPAFPLSDLDGRRRFTDDPKVADTGNGSSPIVDMGAYERIRPIYVDRYAPNGGDGTSWERAFNDLQDALSAAERDDWNDVLWVAAGTYKPDNGTNRFDSFRLEHLALYGGFRGKETSLSERDWRNYETILSGDLGVSGNIYDNSYHVIVMYHAKSTTVLDGFTIMGGMADDHDNVSDEWKKGGGIYNRYSNPRVTNCTFRWNRAAEWGGAMYNRFSSPTVTNCVFTGNEANTDGYVIGSGGGMCNDVSGPTVTNCTFSGNWADDFGGGMYNTFYGFPCEGDMNNDGDVDGSDLAVFAADFGRTDCDTGDPCEGDFDDDNDVDGSDLAVFAADFGRTDCPLSNPPLTPTVNNCIFWGNSRYYSGTDETAQISGYAAVRYSCIQNLGAFLGNHNSGANPLLVDADGPDNTFGTADDNPRLSAGSPCIDAGDNEVIPADVDDMDQDGDIAESIPRDLDADARFVDDPATVDTGNGTAPLVDRGAYEFGS